MLGPIFPMGATHVDKGGFQSIFYCLVSAFHGPIGGGVVCGGEFDVNVESPHDVLVQIRNKGIPVVGHRCYGAAEPLDPAHQGFAALLAVGFRHGVTLEPTTCPTKDRKKIFLAFRDWQGTHHVDVDD